MLNVFWKFGDTILRVTYYSEQKLAMRLDCFKEKGIYPQRLLGGRQHNIASAWRVPCVIFWTICVIGRLVYSDSEIKAICSLFFSVSLQVHFCSISPKALNPIMFNMFWGFFNLRCNCSNLCLYLSPLLTVQANALKVGLSGASCLCLLSSVRVVQSVHWFQRSLSADLLRCWGANCMCSEYCSSVLYLWYAVMGRAVVWNSPHDLRYWPTTDKWHWLDFFFFFG